MVFPGIALVSVSTALGAPGARSRGPRGWLLLSTGPGSCSPSASPCSTGCDTRRACAPIAKIHAALLIAIPASLWLSVPIYGAITGFVFAAALPSASTNRPAGGRLACAETAARVRTDVLLAVPRDQIPVKAVSTALYRNGATSELSTLFIVIPLSVGVSVALGWIFHVVVERRFLNAPVREPADRRTTRL